MSRLNALHSSTTNTDHLFTPRHAPIKPVSLNTRTPMATTAENPLKQLPQSSLKSAAFRNDQTPMRQSAPIKGLSVKTPAHPKAPAFAVFNDNAPQQPAEKENIPPIEKMSLPDPEETDLSVYQFKLDPKYENVILKEAGEEEKIEEFEFKLPKIFEDEEFDLDAFNREYADVLGDLQI